VQITVNNLSSQEWRRNNWLVGAGQSNELNWTDEISQTPLEVLRPHTGGATAAASTVHLPALVKDALFMRLGYGSAEGSFAVEVRQLFHMFTIGKQSQWLHWHDNRWSDSSSDTMPYVWTFKTCKVMATPALSDSSGAISITISDHR
jgi:hypothetical protein